MSNWRKHKTPAPPSPLKPDLAASKVETVTQAPTPVPQKRSSFKGDPQWDARRVRIDGVLLASFGLCGFSLYMGTAMAAVVVPPALFLVGGTLGLYMGVAEYGRVQGVMGTSVTTATSTAVRTSSSVKD